MPKGTSMTDLARDHAAAILARFPDGVDVVGESTGGSIALRLAIDHPGAVRRLVVISAAGRMRRRGAEAQNATADDLRAGDPRAAAATMLAGTDDRRAVRAVLRLVGLLAGRLAIGFADRDLVRLIDAEDGFDVEGELERIAAPTVLIGGHRDGYFSPELLARAARRIPDAVAVDLPGKGHLSAALDGSVRKVIRERLLPGG